MNSKRNTSRNITNHKVTPPVLENQSFDVFTMISASTLSRVSYRTSFSPRRIPWENKISKNAWYKKGQVGNTLKKKSFVGIRESLECIEIFYLDEKRSARRLRSNMNWRHEKIYPTERKRMVLWNVDPLLYNCPVLADFLWFLINCVVHFSAPLCEVWFWLLLMRRWNLKNSCTKWQSPSQIWRV